MAKDVKFFPLREADQQRLRLSSAPMSAGYANETGITFTRSDNVQIKLENLYTLQEALDLLGVALAEHGHTWSVEERTAYDKATGIIGKALK